MAASQRRSSCVGLFLLAMVVMAAMAEANSTVKNNSKQAVELIPSVGKPIVIKPGATADVPTSAISSCKFKNLYSGNTQGPFTLPDATILVIVDAVVTAKVDIYVASLVGLVLKLLSCICSSL